MRTAPKVEATARKEDGIVRLLVLRSFGPTAAAVGMRALGFSPHEAERLLTLKLRYLRGEFPKPTIDQKRTCDAGARSESRRSRARTPLAQIPIGRAIQPEDIAYAVLHFASAKASAVTGQVMSVDGGTTRGIFY